jgi:hypothetical protein
MHLMEPMEPEGSLPLSQESATCYVRENQINPVYAPILFIEGPFNILPSTPRASKLSLSFRSFTRRGHAVAQLVEALHYKPERRGFDSRWCHWNFSLT